MCMRRKGTFWLKKLKKKKGSVTSAARLSQLQHDIDKVGWDALQPARGATRYSHTHKLNL